MSREESSASARRAYSNPLRAILRLSVLIPHTAGCYLGNLLGLVLAPREQRRSVSVRWTHRWFRLGARIVGLRVEAYGPPPPPGSLITPNHTGYADVIALGSVCAPFFVAKADVARWPVMGHFFTVSQQIGVPRRASKGIASANVAVAERLLNGHSVCVFLEGTSSGGGDPLPFHGSLLQPAIDVRAQVVPVAIRWTAADERVNISEDVAYWKDHVFVPHFWRLLGLKGIRAAIAFGEPLDPEGRTRKELADAVRDRVVTLLEP